MAAKNSVGLTDAKILGMKPPSSGQVEHADGILAGLRVRVGCSGAKTFILRKRIAGRQHNITLGRYGVRFTLADARKKARGLLVDIETRGEPVTALTAQRRQDDALGTVREIWNQYIAREVTGKKRSAGEIERIGARYILPAIGNRLADSLTRADVTMLVEGVTYARPDKPALSMGLAVYRQLSAFYTWAMPRLDRLPANPCRDAGRPRTPAARDRHLTEREIAAFWRSCTKMGWPFGPAFQLMLLTAQRRGEVFSADRAEFGRDEWTIPAVRAKNGVAHVVFVTDAAWSILDALPAFRGTDKLFPSQSDAETGPTGFSKAHKRLCAFMAAELEIESVEPFVLHDLRRTAATGMQRLGIVQPVVEAVLNHVSGSQSGIAGVYQRHHFKDEKRHALEAWAAEVERIVAGRALPNVVPIRGRPAD